MVDTLQAIKRAAKEVTLVQDTVWLEAYIQEKL